MLVLLVLSEVRGFLREVVLLCCSCTRCLGAEDREREIRFLQLMLRNRAFPKSFRDRVF